MEFSGVSERAAKEELRKSVSGFGKRSYVRSAKDFGN